MRRFLERLRAGARWCSVLLNRLGWFYALAAAIAVVALLGFAELSEEVLEGDVRAVDEAVLRSLYANASPPLDSFALMLSRLGGVVGTATVGCVAVLAFLGRRRRLDAGTLALTLLGATALVAILKHTFRQPRPDLFESLAPEQGFGFPSGHALMSVALYGYLGAVLVMDGPRRAWRWVAGSAFLGLSLGIVWSRLYLGVHWLSDVTAGSLVAVFWLACCLLGRHYARNRPSSAEGVRR